MRSCLYGAIHVIMYSHMQELMIKYKHRLLHHYSYLLNAYMTPYHWYHMTRVRWLDVLFQVPAHDSQNSWGGYRQARELWTWETQTHSGLQVISRLFSQNFIDYSFHCYGENLGEGKVTRFCTSCVNNGAGVPVQHFISHWLIKAASVEIYLFSVS